MWSHINSVNQGMPVHQGTFYISPETSWNGVQDSFEIQKLKFTVYCVDAYLFSFFFAIFHRQALIIRIILSRNGICSFEHLILRWKKRWFVEKRSVWFCKEQDHIKTLNSGRHAFISHLSNNFNLIIQSLSPNLF